MSNSCQRCDKFIEGQYKYCMDCNEKHNEAKVRQEILMELKLINNNLAHLRAHVCKDEVLKKKLATPKPSKPSKAPAQGK